MKFIAKVLGFRQNLSKVIFYGKLDFFKQNQSSKGTAFQSGLVVVNDGIFVRDIII